MEPPVDVDDVALRVQRYWMEMFLRRDDRIGRPNIEGCRPGKLVGAGAGRRRPEGQGV